MPAVRSENKKFYVVLAISYIIMFGFGFLPPFGQITPMGMQILGIFLGCLFAWAMGELVWSSLSALVIMALFGHGTVASNYAAAWGNSTVATMMCGLVFCFAIQSCGLLKELARWIVCRKWAQRSPWGLITAFYIAALVLGILAANILAPVILLWSLFYEIAHELDIKPYSKYVTVILTGVTVFVCAGVVMMPYSAMTALVAGIATSFDANFSFNSILYMISNLVVDILFLPVALFVFKYILKLKFDVSLQPREPYKIQWTKSIKVTMFYLVVLIIALVIPNLLPKEMFIAQIVCGKLGIVGVLITISVLLAITRIEGKPLLNIEDALNKGIPWPMLMLVSSALAMSDYLVAEGTGIVPTIVSFLSPLVAGRSSVTIIVIFVAVALLMTNVINDVATAAVLYPIAAYFITNAGGSVSLFACLFTAAVIQGCFMPSGSIAGAMMHGNKEWLRPKDIFKYVGILEIVLCCVMAFVAYGGTLLGM